MFGGDNNSSIFPVFLEENHFPYDVNGLPQLQLFGNMTAGCNVGPVNYIGNEHTAVNRPIKRVREGESTFRQQKHQLSLDKNFHQDEGGQPGSVLNPNPVSTGLRLSYEEEEHNSSITSVSGNMKGRLPVILSLSDNLKVEINRQKVELHQYMRLQEQNIIKGITDLKHRQTISLLNTIEKGVGKKLHEKEVEIENMNSKNKDLMERIKQMGMEAQSWHYKAKYNESVVNVLKNNLKQVMEQGGGMHGKEGYGDSEVDDAASYINQNHLELASGSANPLSMKKQMICRACNMKEVCVLFLPCRHLCLCTDCEVFVDVCPVCQVMKTASVQVYMS